MVLCFLYYSLVFTRPPSGLRRAETFHSACVLAENEEQMWMKTNKTEAESMWFRSVSAVFSQADPLGRFPLISKSVTTTSTEAAETLKGKLKFKLNLEGKKSFVYAQQRIGHAKT